MENEQSQSDNLFSLQIDNPIKSYLGETAKWGRFLAIVGFVICGIVVIAGLAFAATYSTLTSTYDQPGRYGGQTNPFAMAGPMMAIFYILFALLYFFPCLYLLRFSNRMKKALLSDDQDTLSESFRNLKALFRFVGILTMIIISIYALIFLIGIVTLSTL